jgi:hypothetical protein
MLSGRLPLSCRRVISSVPPCLRNDHPDLGEAVQPFGIIFSMFCSAVLLSLLILETERPAQDTCPLHGRPQCRREPPQCHTNNSALKAALIGVQRSVRRVATVSR